MKRKIILALPLSSVSAALFRQRRPSLSWFRWSLRYDLVAPSLACTSFHFIVIDKVVKLFIPSQNHQLRVRMPSCRMACKAWFNVYEKRFRAVNGTQQDALLAINQAGLSVSPPRVRPGSISHDSHHASALTQQSVIEQSVRHLSGRMGKMRLRQITVHLRPWSCRAMGWRKLVWIPSMAGSVLSPDWVASYRSRCREVPVSVITLPWISATV